MSTGTLKFSSVFSKSADLRVLGVRLPLPAPSQIADAVGLIHTSRDGSLFDELVTVTNNVTDLRIIDFFAVLQQ
jgi:hypothetical protein